MTSSGPTRRQREAREAFRNRPVNPYFNQLANQSLTSEYKLRPDSSFSQYDLDRFNRRQDNARSQYSSLYGADSLQDVTRYDRVEDIPVYTDEELEQQKIERLKANPRSAYNYKRPQPAFGEGPKNQKVPQAVVDAYNNLSAKFAQLRDTGNQNAVNRADFDAIFTAAENAEPEFIQEGEVYDGPDFRDSSGKLLRERASSSSNPATVDFLRNRVYGKSPNRTSGAAPSQGVGENRQIGRSRSAAPQQQNSAQTFNNTSAAQPQTSGQTFNSFENNFGSRNTGRRSQGRPERMSYAESNQLGSYSPNYIESRRLRDSARKQFANTPQSFKDLSREFSRNGASENFRSGLFSLNKDRYEERYGDQGGGGGAQSSMSQPASPSYKDRPNPMPNGRSDRGNYSRGPVARETATSTPTRRTSTITPENPRGITPPYESASSTPTRRSFNPELANPPGRSSSTSTSRPSSRSSRATVNTSRSNRASRERAVIDNARDSGAADRTSRETASPRTPAPAESAASTPTRRDNPRSRNRRQREQGVAADARRNRRNRGGSDASTRSNRRAQRERAVVDRQGGGRGQRGVAQ
jgi:hypothetical protein